MAHRCLRHHHPVCRGVGLSQKVRQYDHQNGLAVFYSGNDFATGMVSDLASAVGGGDIDDGGCDGFGPTIRKAYIRPFEEQLLFFVIMSLRNLISISTLEHYSLTTVLFPAVIAGVCLIFILMVMHRRRVLVAL